MLRLSWLHRLHKDMAKKRYSDLDLDFITHPVSGDITFKYDEDAVKQSIRNLVMMGIYEKPFHPEIRSEISKMLFENFTSITSFEIQKQIEDIISEHEPRASIVSVMVTQSADYNYLNVSLSFFLKGANNKLFDMRLPLERVR